MKQQGSQHSLGTQTAGDWRSLACERPALATATSIAAAISRTSVSATHSYRSAITQAHTLSVLSFLLQTARRCGPPLAITQSGNCSMKHKPCRLRGAAGVRVSYDRSEMATDWRVLSLLTHADSPPLTARRPGFKRPSPTPSVNNFCLIFLYHVTFQTHNRVVH